MSKLKADKTFVFGEECEAYKKYEADKVIAEKDAKIIQLEALIENYNRISREIIDNANHQKHKRCLAMALLWLERSENSTDLENELVSRKRCSKWMELAEKFKPNSTAQQGKG